MRMFVSGFKIHKMRKFHLLPIRQSVEVCVLFSHLPKLPFSLFHAITKTQKKPRPKY